MAKASVKVLLASLGLLALAGCASTSDKAAELQNASTTSTSTGADSDTVTTSGLGDDTGFTKGRGDTSATGVGSSASGLHRATLQVGNQTYYFNYDKSDVHDADRASVEVQAKYLVSHPKAKVLLEGNTDPRGSREYNIALGERRAKAVANILRLQGVADAQIRIVSYGAEKLASQGHTDEDYQLDRRVNLVYEAK